MIHAKKSLGQNFLNSKKIARAIISAGELSSTDTVLEIGPGKGFLTSELLLSGAHVIAVEKDDRMIPLLKEKFANEIKRKQLVVIHEDILNIIQNKERFFILEKNDHPLFDYKLVANIPYYLTGQIIRNFLEAKNKPTQMILMVQNEVATRILARDKKESILSIAVKVYGAPRLVKKVPARYFTPAPKVNSAVIAIESISNKNFTENSIDEKKFFEVLRAGFAHKRKKLAGNLRHLFGDKTIDVFSYAKINMDARAEDITLSNWIAIVRCPLQ